VNTEKNPAAVALAKLSRVNPTKAQIEASRHNGRSWDGCPPKLHLFWCDACGKIERLQGDRRQWCACSPTAAVEMRRWLALVQN
jgi:hypothetical protein